MTIDCNYVIERNEGDEIVEYFPRNEFKHLENLTLIEGPNSSGKSTLLHLMALGFYGLRSERIPDSLKRRMASLAQRPDQKVTFQISVTLGDGKTALVSEKEQPTSPEIAVYEVSGGKKKPLPYELFSQRYDLIYDIPENPTDRIRQLVGDIAESQSFCLNRVTQVKIHLLRVIDSVRQGPSRQRVAQLAEELDEVRATIRSLGDQAEAYGARQTAIEQYYLGRQLIELREQYATRENQRNLINVERARADRRAKKLGGAVRQRVEAVECDLELLRQLHASIVSRLREFVSRKDAPLLLVWERTDFTDFWKNGAIPRTFVEDARKFSKILEQRFSGRDAKKLDEIKLYRELVDLLSRYRSLNLEIPGTGLTLDKFLAALNRKAQGFAAIESAAAKVTAIKGDLEKLISDATMLDGQLHEVKDLRANAREEVEELGKTTTSPETVHALDQEVERLRNQVTDVEIRCGRVGITPRNVLDVLDKLESTGQVSDFVDSTLSDLDASLQETQSLFRQTEREVNQAKARESYLDGDLQRLKAQKPHPYQNRLEDLTKVLEVCNLLESRLQREFKRALSAIGAVPPSSPSDEFEERYFESVGTYLATKLKTVRYGEKTYVTTKVDIANGAIIAKGGKKILLQDFGTGQGQAAYLQGILSRNDGRKVIALIDEIAMMDKESLAPVVARLQEMDQEGRLLIGIVVQRAESPKVVPLAIS